jgi:hypothetical protein
MGSLPDISNLLEVDKNLFDTWKNLRDATERLEEGRKMLRDEIVQLYKTAQVTPKECNHPVAKYQGMGMNYCECCDTHLS